MRCPKCQAEILDDSQFCSKCGTQVQPGEKGESFVRTKTIQTAIREVAPGSLFAEKYRIIEEIGRGGMGVVYKAEDLKLKRTVALKFLPPEMMRHPEAKERFIREAQAAAALDYPNICTVHEVDEADDQTFIAMSYLEGKSLKEKLKSGPLDVNEALDIAEQVAEGLREAHAKGIVHRDIKPANIMLTAKGQVKITDFGLAKFSWGVDLTKTATVMGTVAYMSPEQAKGEAVDHRTDIWSFGVVLYEMFTGALPFKGEHEQSLMYAIMNKEPLPLMKGRLGIPKDVENIVHTALAKNITERYQSFEDILGDLQAVTQGLKPMKAKRRAARTKILGLKKVHFYAGIAALVILISAAVMLLLPRPSEALDSIAVLPLVNYSGDPEQDYFVDSLTDMLTADLYKISALRVIPPQSVRIYKNTDKSPKGIAEELKVKAIVQASVQKSENRIRLIARLIDPSQDRQIWAETFEREIVDIFFLQSELSQAIVRGIRVAVSPEESARLASAKKVNPEAFDLCLQGLSIWQSPREQISDYRELSSRALSCFKKAIEIDPNVALAYAWISEITMALGVNNLMSMEDAAPIAKEAALKAIELDDNLAQAHSALGFVLLMMDWDFEAADRESRRAMELEPGNHWIRYGYYDNLTAVGKFDEAIAGIKPLLEEPAIRRFYLHIYATFCIEAGRYDEAIDILEKDSNPVTITSLAKAYAQKGNYDKAISLIEQIKNAPGMKEHPNFLRVYACILAISGRREEALKKLEELENFLAKNNSESFFLAACVYAALGEKDEAFRRLYQAYESHSPQMIELLSEGWFRSLYGDPRFEDLLKKVGLSEV